MLLPTRHWESPTPVSWAGPANRQEPWSSDADVDLVLCVPSSFFLEPLSPCPQDPGTGNTEESSCERLSHWPGGTCRERWEPWLPLPKLGRTSTWCSFSLRRWSENPPIRCVNQCYVTHCFLYNQVFGPGRGDPFTAQILHVSKIQAVRWRLYEGWRLKFKWTRKKGVCLRKWRTSLAGGQPRKAFWLGLWKGRAAQPKAVAGPSSDSR